MSNKKTVKDLQEEIKTWADQVFPDRTPYSALAKMIMEEVPELLNGGQDDPGEWADLLILVLDAADLRGIDVVQAAWDKMEINKTRTWEVDPETGIMHHV